jgi:hypothetical protein
MVLRAEFILFSCVICVFWSGTSDFSSSILGAELSYLVDSYKSVQTFVHLQSS